MKYCLFFLLNDSYVELEGVEPSSKQGNHMLSTCLSLLKFSCCSKTKATNCCLILCFFAARTRLRATIPDLSAPLYQIASGRGHLRDVSSWHLVSGWSLIYSIRLSSKSVIIFASYCFEIRDLRAGIPTLDMLTYLFYLLSKPNSPKTQHQINNKSFKTVINYLVVYFAAKIQLISHSNVLFGKIK